MMTNQRNALTTVVSYPERGEGGNNKYRGNCSPKLIEDLIAHFGVQEICDYMCGSNTTGDAARTMGIYSHTYDLHSGFDLLHSDIPERPQFIFWHPPYWDIIKYSDVMYRASEVQQRYGYDPRRFDLSRIPTWEGFVQAMNYCMMNQKEDLLSAYEKLLEAEGKKALAAKLMPGIRFSTSDTGVASAKVSALLMGLQYPIHIGGMVAVEHRRQSKVPDFVDSLDMLFAQFGETTLKELTGLGVRHVMTCFDMDYLKNWHVEAAYVNLVNLLGGLPLTFGTYLWSPDYNGLDDFIWEFFMEKRPLE